jgi:hypothetical protein
MSHRHAVIITQHVTQPHLVLLYQSFELAEWSEVYQTLGLHHFTAHAYHLVTPKHKDICLAWLNGATVQMRMPGGEFEDYQPEEEPDFSPSMEYQVKPSGLMEVWVGTQKEDKSSTIAIPVSGNRPKFEGFTFTKVEVKREL